MVRKHSTQLDTLMKIDRLRNQPNRDGVMPGVVVQKLRNVSSEPVQTVEIRQRLPKRRFALQALHVGLVKLAKLLQVKRIMSRSVNAKSPVMKFQFLDRKLPFCK